MLLLEPVVEALGDLLHVEGRPDAARHIDKSHVCFLVQGDDKLLQLFEQGFARLPPAVDMRAGPARSARLALDPVPVLCVQVMSDVHDEMFADGSGNDALDFLPRGVVREGSGGFSDALVDDHAAFVGNGVQRKRPAAYGGMGVRAAMVPAEFIDEQRLEREMLQVASYGVSVELGGHGKDAPVFLFTDVASRAKRSFCDPA